jgi:hypothetical protein
MKRECDRSQKTPKADQAVWFSCCVGPSQLLIFKESEWTGDHCFVSLSGTCANKQLTTDVHHNLKLGLYANICPCALQSADAALESWQIMCWIPACLGSPYGYYILDYLDILTPTDKKA